uniref:Chromatin modification-related protein EAF7 n=4 Tax=Triticinae TaxID=1648030 RepID=A0A452ZJD3_AEGTS
RSPGSPTNFVVAHVKGSGMEAAADEEQEGLSAQSPAQAPPSSASSLPKEQSQVELELRLLQALEFYPPSKLKGIHRHFILYGLMEYLRKSLDRQFSADEVLQLLDRFFNLEMLKPDDDEKDNFGQTEEFALPDNFFKKED